MLKCWKWKIGKIGGCNKNGVQAGGGVVEVRCEVNEYKDEYDNDDDNDSNHDGNVNDSDNGNDEDVVEDSALVVEAGEVLAPAIVETEKIM